MHPSVYLTAWVAFVLWAAGEVLLAADPARAGGFRRARLVWTLGAVALSVHLVLAFDRVHAWSHSAAVNATARQLQESMGISWGGGVWINYLLVAVWWIDVGRSWRWFDRWNRRGLPRAVRRFGFWFLWFNAAVVFASGGRRWIAAVVCAGVLVTWWRGRGARDSGEPMAAVH